MSPPLEENIGHQGKTLQTYSHEEVLSHNTAESLWISRAGKVYDVTRFSKIHPGGLQPLLDYGGEEVAFIMHVKESHRHSANAYKIMEKYHIGYMEGAKESEEKLFDSSDVFTEGDLAKEPVNWKEPMFWQVGGLGRVYNAWTHTPVDDQIRLFGPDFLEVFTRCSWWMVPLFWSWVILFHLVVTHTNIAESPTISWFGLAFTANYAMATLFFLMGVCLWTLLEYTIHRWVFHIEPPADSPFLITIHFIFHGQHHKSPMDPGRLVFPPLPALALYIPILYMYHSCLPRELVNITVAGTICGYMAYDLVHYYVHHGSPPRDSYLGRVKYWHMKHHYVDYQKGFGISSRFWDYPFNTAFRQTAEAHRKDN